MSTFPIVIDATGLFYRFFIIPGVTPEFVDSRTAQTLQLAPGEYSFQVQSGVLTDLSFTVTPQGTLDYDHSCDTFVGGRGTSLLQLIGFEVTLDASSLSGALGGGGVLLASMALTNHDWIQRRTVRLLPQSIFGCSREGVLSLSSVSLCSEMGDSRTRRSSMLHRVGR